MIVRTETNDISETDKDEVPTDLMRPQDVPGCTPFLDNCLKEKSEQGHGTISVRLSMGCDVEGGVYSAVHIALR
jgi:hypothetical protein